MHNLFGNPIYAGVDAVLGVRATDRRRQKPGRPGSRRPPRPDEAEIFLPDRLPAYISWEQFQRNQEQLRANRPDHVGAGAGRHRAAVRLASLRSVRIAHGGALQQ